MNRRFVIAVAIVSLVTPLVTRPATAQTGARSSVGLALGPSIGAGITTRLPADFGGHLQFSFTRWQTDRTGIRAELLAQALPTVEAIPECVVSSPCESFFPHPSQLYGLSIGAMYRHVPTRVYAVASGGAFVGLTARGDHFGTSPGLSAGLGLTPFSRRGRGLGLEVRYWQLLDRMGDLYGTLTSSLAIAF